MRWYIMKKTVIGFIFGVILTLSVGSYAMTAIKSAQYNDTKIQLDGKTLTLKDQCVTVVNDGTEWGFNTIPIRAFFESIGYSVDWDSKSNTILLESPLTDLETVAKNCKDSCVMIYVYRKDGVYAGSGWVYNDYIITVKHVIKDATKINVFDGNSKYGVTGTVHYVDPKLDIAVLKINAKLPSVTLGDSEKLNEGERLVGITSPAGMQNTIDECVYSGKVYTSSNVIMGISETSMVGGSSGGAIFNYDSEIVGMAIAGTDGEIGAIPINDIKPILDKLK